MRTQFRISIQVIALIITASLIISFIPCDTMAQSGDHAEVPRNDPPTIDGVVETEEWNGSEVITLTIEGNDADVYFKHNGEYIYFGFDIQEGHNSAFPDTRVFFDTHHDAASSPQEDDYQLYINPDNEGLIERQGDGDQWQAVDITHWTGNYNEDGNDHWTTEYNVSSEKFGNFTGNETLGFALLVYGNSPSAFDVWPDNADIDDPSTWGDISFLNWTEEKEEPEDPPNDPPGTNNTDPNGTTNNTGEGGDEDDDFLGLPVMIVLLTVFIAAVVRKHRIIID